MIRLATTADLAAVLELGKAAFEKKQDKPDADWLVRCLSQEGVRLLVDDAGLRSLRGFLLTRETSEGVAAQMIAVLKGYRREGVARRLLASVKGPAGAWIRETNTASRTLFKRAGFRMTTRYTEGSVVWCFYHRGK